MMKVNTILLAALGLFFFITGVMKLMDPLAFLEAVKGYRLVDGRIALLVSLWLPWSECILAVALTRPSFRFFALACFLALLFFFQLALGSAFIRGLDISCGCFGAENSSSIEFALIRNGLLMILVLYLMQVFKGASKPSRIVA